ncbi:putative thiol-disulfide isomerase/thioredoxins-like [Bradyrhizobium sp. STM 3843]|uniref:TlpA family protein disulfide reductase n=1 Tax=Bradyrhizobium sp. STM 3843 TaxID=551947 RepID=UPI0002406BE7|nr:TlpA disulfide reductase family protein [Bradyrhizobium sp. STM 3843]CCE05907.1 putative thiol-disulfide isomerase/thioredoxins-like [Bradyrhizobium sp. STM 3843]
MRRVVLGIVALAGLTLGLSAIFAATSPLKPFERGSWREVLHAHAGRPTLVHFWGVTCGPCKVELPQLGEFMKAHPGIDVVTISADLVPNLPAATQATLDRAGLSAAENFIFNDGYAERLRFEIDPSWQGDIPRTMLIGRDGAISTIEGSADLAELDKWSAEQLAAGPQH